LTSSDLASHAQTDGDDIVFTDNSEVKLNHEIEFYNSTDGHLVAWANANLSSTTDTVLYVYYGNNGASNQQNPTGVWDSGFKGVWHLPETSGLDYDSTSNNNDGTYFGSSQNAVGKIDGTDNFDGTDDYINIGTSSTLDLTGDLTIEAWINPDTWGQSNWGRILSRRKDSPSQGYEFMLDNDAAEQRLWFSAMGLTDSYSNMYSIGLGRWQHVVVTRASGGSVTFYVNGSASGTGSAATITSSPMVSTYIGWRGTDSAREFDGLIDEVRVSISIRNAEWISTEYNNMNSPSTFYTVGSEEMVPTNTSPSVSSPSPANGATDVQISLTELSFILTDSQSDLIDYNVTVSPDVIGGLKNGTGISNGTKIHVPVTSSLQFNTTYAWFVNATDPSGSGQITTSSYTFKTQIWYSTNWQHRKKITVNSSQVTGSLSGFPVLIDITDSDLSSDAQQDGDDILFTDSTGNKLNHEIEYYDNNTGHLTAWVKTDVSSSADTILFMYYGCPSASNQQNPTGVWNPDFLLVQHIEEVSGIESDSTLNDNDGSANGGLNQNAIGKVDGADQFDGYDDYVDIPDDTSLDMGTGSYTLEGWAKIVQNSANDSDIVWKGPAVGIKDTAYGVRIRAAGGIRGGMQDASVTQTTYTTYDSATQYDDGQWHYVTLTVDRTGYQQKAYVDGNQIGATTNIAGHTYDIGNSWSLTIGKGIGMANGTIDEVRVSRTVRSANWILTCFKNQKDPSSFCSVATEESVMGFPAISNPDPADGATGVAIGVTQLSFDISDPENNLMNYTATTSPNVGSASGTNVYGGRFNFLIGGLVYSTPYNWHIVVTDGINQTDQTFTFTTRPQNYPPSISNPFPSDGVNGIPPLNPLLSAQIADLDGDLINITFSTNASGTWQEPSSYTNVGAGTYSAESTNVSAFSTLYHWRVNATDGKVNVTAMYSFTTLGQVQYLGIWFCWGNAETGRSAVNPDRYYVIFQHADGDEHSPFYAEFDRNLGWVVVDQPVCDWSNETIQNGHPFLMYYDDQIHLAWSYGGDAAHDDPVNQYIDMISANTFDDFHSMMPGTRSTPITEDFDDRYVGNAYSFDNDDAWHFGRNGSAHIEYWTWNPTSGWSIPGTVLTQTSPGWGPGLLPMNRTHYLLYYQVRESDTVRYVESFDAGQTWGTEQTALTNIPDYSTRMSFVRYGDSILFVLLDGTDNHIVLYNSTDGKTWTYMTEIYNQSAMVPSISMLNQKAILWAASDIGTANLVAGMSFIPEMLAYPQTPTNPYPGNNTIITQAETKVRLNVTVHGTQTYDVAFYWANGTFIGEDKLLREGEVATCEVSGLRDGLTYSWFAMARGTTYDYWGNEPDATTDETVSATYSFTFLTGKPRLDLSADSSTCHFYGENIAVKVDISNASNVEDFEFEIHYNTTLLDYTSITWNAWGSGTINVDETNGQITGSTAGNALGDNATLITIVFSAKCHHLWKDLPGWINDQNGAIYIQGANLSYPGGSVRIYEKDGLSEIDIGPDIGYTFSPIRGDVDNSGNVDLTDLRTVAAFYGQENTTYNLTGETTVDIFDLVVIATNYGYSYP
jgi:hypothetical protein